MQLKVGQLDEHLARRRESSFTARLGDLRVDDVGATISVSNPLTSESWVLDDPTLKLLGRFLKVPVPYLQAVDPDFRVQLLRYELERHRQAEVTLESVDGNLVAVHSPSQVMIPQGEVLALVARVFTPEDTVRRLIVDGERLHVDVTTARSRLITTASAPLPDEVVGRGAPATVSVGDITEAGVRFLIAPFTSTPPSVTAYAERLVCSNGMTTEQRLGRVMIKGHTLPEVIEGMEAAAQAVLGNLPDHLEALLQTRSTPVPGEIAAFAAQLAREAGLSRSVLDAVLDILNQQTGPVSVWDVTQAFTAVANRVERYQTMIRLQTLGGALAFDAPRMLERCGACERLL